MHTGQPNPHSMIDEHISGKIVLDTSSNKFIFPAINVSNNFATIDYDSHVNTKMDKTINHVFRSMTVQELNTLHKIFELERNQLLTILAMSVQNPQLAGFLLTRNRSNFLYVEGSTAWLNDCPHFLSPLYKADRCFDRIPIHFKDTLMYILLLDKLMTMLLQSHVIITNETLLNSIPILTIKIFTYFDLNLSNVNLH